GARTPRRPLLEQLVAGERDDERPARTLTARRDAFDEIQHRGLEALRVLEHDEHRMVAGQTLDHGDKPGLHLVDERGLVPALAERDLRRPASPMMVTRTGRPVVLASPRL